MLVMLGQDYVPQVKDNMKGKEKVEAVDPVLLPDKAIWHPVAPSIVFENNVDYFNWFNRHRGQDSTHHRLTHQH